MLNPYTDFTSAFLSGLQLSREHLRQREELARQQEEAARQKELFPIQKQMAKTQAEQAEMAHQAALQQQLEQNKPLNEVFPPGVLQWEIMQRLPFMPGLKEPGETDAEAAQRLTQVYGSMPVRNLALLQQIPGALMPRENMGMPMEFGGQTIQIPLGAVGSVFPSSDRSVGASQRKQGMVPLQNKEVADLLKIRIDTPVRPSAIVAAVKMIETLKQKKDSDEIPTDQINQFLENLGADPGFLFKEPTARKEIALGILQYIVPVIINSALNAAGYAALYPGEPSITNPFYRGPQQGPGLPPAATVQPPAGQLPAGQPPAAPAQPPTAAAPSPVAVLPSPAVAVPPQAAQPPAVPAQPPAAPVQPPAIPAQPPAAAATKPAAQPPAATAPPQAAPPPAAAAPTSPSGLPKDVEEQAVKMINRVKDENSKPEVRIKVLDQLEDMFGGPKTKPILDKMFPEDERNRIRAKLGAASGAKAEKEETIRPLPVLPAIPFPEDRRDGKRILDDSNEMIRQAAQATRAQIPGITTTPPPVWQEPASSNFASNLDAVTNIFNRSEVKDALEKLSPMERRLFKTWMSGLENYAETIKGLASQSPQKIIRAQVTSAVKPNYQLQTQMEERLAMHQRAYLGQILEGLSYINSRVQSSDAKKLVNQLTLALGLSRFEETARQNELNNQFRQAVIDLRKATLQLSKQEADWRKKEAEQRLKLDQERLELQKRNAQEKQGSKPPTMITPEIHQEALRLSENGQNLPRAVTFLISQGFTPSLVKSWLELPDVRNHFKGIIDDLVADKTATLQNARSSLKAQLISYQWPKYQNQIRENIIKIILDTATKYGYRYYPRGPNPRAIPRDVLNQDQVYQMIVDALKDYLSSKDIKIPS